MSDYIDLAKLDRLVSEFSNVETAPAMKTIN